MSRDNKKDKNNNSGSYFNYYCNICNVYTKTSHKRHNEIVHYKGSFDKEEEYREPEVNDKRKSTNQKEYESPFFIVDKKSEPSQYTEDDSKSQAESPKKRQKRSPYQEKPSHHSKEDEIPLYDSTSFIEPISISKSTSLSDPISDLKIEDTKSSSSKLRAEAPEFIPLAAKAKQVQRRAFSDTFEQTLEVKEEEEEEQQRPIVDKETLPPWLREIPRLASKLSLHEEIIEFVRWISPTPEEQCMRQDVIKRISNVINNLWPDADIHIFGSFSTELFLPYSDLDLVVMGAPGRHCLDDLSIALQDSGLIQNIQIISNAKVPIIKMMDAQTGCAVDISFNIGNGPENTRIIQKYIQQLPLLRPIALVVKYFLQQRALNETYSGGIGSYALILLILSFLQHHSLNKNLKYWEEDLGVLLTDFFDFYGTKFNYRRTGISVRDGGSYFNKESEGEPYWNYEKPMMLAIEDPHDPSNNVSRGSFQIVTIRSSFAYAFRILMAENADFAPSKLSRILNIDETMVKYRQFIKEMYKSRVNSVEKRFINNSPSVVVDRKRYNDEKKYNNNNKEENKKRYNSNNNNDYYYNNGNNNNNNSYGGNNNNYSRKNGAKRTY